MRETESAARWARPAVMRLPAAHPFKPAAQIQQELGLAELLRLGSNENPLGPSPAAQAAAMASLSRAHLYPEAGYTELRAGLAEAFGLSPDQVVVDQGISGILRLVLSAFVRPGDRVVYPWPSFPPYRDLTYLVDGVPVPVPLTGTLEHDLAAMAAAAREARVVILCNPNNPTGTAIDPDALAEFMAAVPEETIVVADEAYIEYAAGEPAVATALPYVKSGRPVIVTRTFSKVYGLAGLRVGYGLTTPALADALNRAHVPMAVSETAQVAALAALADTGHLQRTVELARTGRAYLTAALTELGLQAIPSYANFLLVRTGGDARPLATALLQHGVMVRATDGLFDLPGHLRITVGLPEQNQRVVAALAAELGRA